TLDDIRRFRQLDSKCPGHPEYHWTSGVETTTGPLGQGVATSVGMAIAGRWLAARYNRPDYPLFDYDVYALGGDGCMMEGVSGEAASLAGHLRLPDPFWVFDNKPITVEGGAPPAFSRGGPGPLPPPAPCGSRTSVGSTTTIASRSRGGPTSRSRRTSRAGSSPTVG